MAKKTASSEPAAGKARTKGQVFSAIAENVGLARKDVAAVFGGMADLIKRDLSKRGPGIFTIPGLLKLKVIHKPATKARKGIDPFTKQERMFKAKPARRLVRARPLKALKDMVS